MSAGTGQLPSFAGPGGPVHLIAPFLRWRARRNPAAAWDRFERAVTFGGPADIRRAREALFGGDR